MTSPSRPPLQKEFVAGAAATALTVPMSVALGVMTLQPLGAEFASVGVAAGIYTLIFGSLFAVAFGERGIGLIVPVSITAVFVSSMLTDVGRAVRAASGEAASPALLYAATFFFLALTGAFQALIGIFRLGMLVKYLPHAVLAGFMNAVAVLLLLAQVPGLFGMHTGAQLMELFVAPQQARLGAFAVAAVTIATHLLAQALRWRVPPPVAALVAGMAAHHLLAAAGFGSHLGPTLGHEPPLTPRLDTLATFPAFMDSPAFAAALPGIATAAFGLALIVSLQSLLNVKALERTTGERPDYRNALSRSGLANAAAAVLGAIPGGMSLTSSQSVHDAGGRTSAATIAHALAAFALLAALGPVLAAIPFAVIAAMLVVIALRVADTSILATAWRLFGGGVRNRSRIATDVLLMLIVASIAMLASVPLAVGAGLAIAVLSFAVNMSHSVVRQVQRGDTARSRRSRGAAQMELLAAHGRRIVVLELEGVVFFGTADDLLERIEALLDEGATHVILDLRRVHDVDTTGAEMLIRIDERVRARGRRLLVAQAAPGDPQWDFLVDTGVIASLGEAAFLPDTDRALELAENEVIDALHGERSVRAEIPVSQLQPFALLDARELALLAPHLQRRTFAPGAFVFREGDPGDEMFVIAMGTASVRRTDGARSHRLVTFGEGTVFGEMALLDAQPRSASVQADGPLVCYVLGREDFETLVSGQHRIALKLLTSLSQELGRRLRFANETINHLQN